MACTAHPGCLSIHLLSRFHNTAKGEGTTPNQLPGLRFPGPWPAPNPPNPPPHCANSPSHSPQHNPHSVQSAPKFSSSRTTPVPPPSPGRPRQSQSQFDQHPTTPTPSTNYLLDNITGCFTDPKHLDSFLSFPLEYVIVGLDITIFQPTLPLSVFLTPSRTAES